MKAPEFYNIISKCKIDLKEHVSDDIKLQWIIEKMTIIKKDKFASYNNEIASLLGNYTLEDFLVGKVKIFSSISFQKGKIYFGEIDLDKLYIDTLTNEIKLARHEDEIETMKCSLNDECFLELLSCYCKYVVDKFKKNKFDTNYIKNDYLIDIAGGEQYARFCNYLFDL